MATLTLQPDATDGLDTRLRSASATTNYGTNAELHIGEAASASVNNRTLIKFDLSGLPSGAVVSAATLTLHMPAQVDYSTNARTAEIFEVLRAWVESQATWNIWSTGNNWTTAGCGGAGTDFVNTVLGDAAYTATESLPADKIYTFNAAGRAWLEAVAAGTQTNNGWLIKMQTEVDDMYIHDSSDGATAGDRPELIITYTVPAFVPRAMVY